MSRLIFRAHAPSNIAWIKYMGKSDVSLNLPENPSLSLTLNRLRSLAEIRLAEGSASTWVPELPSHASGGAVVPKLGVDSIHRMLKHLERARALFTEALPRLGLSVTERLPAWEIRTANLFPASSGIASSASSFAAMTLAAARASVPDLEAFDKAWAQGPELRRELAKIARVGSGSACRSFEGPFVLWDREAAFAIYSQMPKLAHFVILVSQSEKEVPSSQAHTRVKTSPLWTGRTERAQTRLESVQTALESGDLNFVAQETWREAWEMHSLFHTSAEPFTYWESGTVGALRLLAPKLKDIRPPIVTLDAGPNVHVTVDAQDRVSWKNWLTEKFGSAKIIEDEPGDGAGF